ncbi:hypothetical protein NONI108955_06155 [Nocardia ninae]|uniref:hypothetical protein n=1 Tax=Nocardia ninae TaxID=356145 RepID=UPI0011BF5290|nr:hypothetical protein [Nocardia ninae]
MINRRLPVLALFALSAAAVVLPSNTAAAIPGLDAPVIEETFSVPGTVSAKFRNPNTEGVCWIFNNKTGEIFGGNNPTSFAIPDGKMVQTSLGNLPAGEEIHVRGACAYERPIGSHDAVTVTDVIVVKVVDKPSTGSFG